ncbi:MAG: AmmeMemoRadiSam system protein A [Firmicutes bacterium]|nr:AmmeMemoRadiSam system protein A [Bacillota bacterium]
MGEIVFAAIVPHPPIMIPAVGGREVTNVQQSVKAMEKLAEQLLAVQPDTLVFVTPHGTVFQDAVSLTTVPQLRGDLREFGAGTVSFQFPNDLELVPAITRQAMEDNLPVVGINERLARDYRVRTELDHGIMVPLYFFQRAGINPTLVAISIGLLPFEDLFAFGVAVQKAVHQSGKKVAVIASGDMSHRLTKDAPAGYHPQGKEFDRRIKECVEQGDIKGIINIPQDLAEKAGECGLRSIIIAWGALDGYMVQPEVYSYEGPFGVGYLVANLNPQQPGAAPALLPELMAERNRLVQERRQKESMLVRLARESLEHYVRTGERLPTPAEIPSELRRRAGVFVSIKKHGQLRGCIGTIAPTQPNLFHEIVENAISAGVGDPRFRPVGPEELGDLVYSVDVLQEPEPIQSIDQLDPLRYGVIVRRGRRSGLLLPNLEGIDSAEEQVAIAKRKAGIAPDEPVELSRFEVVRYT